MAIRWNWGLPTRTLLAPIAAALALAACVHWGGSDKAEFRSVRTCLLPPADVIDLDDLDWNNNRHREQIEFAGTRCDLSRRTAQSNSRWWGSRYSTEQLAYANYYAGRGLRIMAEHPDIRWSDPRVPEDKLRRADELFSAARVSEDAPGDVVLQQARVYRLQDRFEAADELLDEYASDVNPGNDALLFERAMLVVDQLPNGGDDSDESIERMEEALRNLERIDSSRSYVGRHAPRQTTILANKLGVFAMSRPLTRSNLSEARDRLESATEQVRLSGDVTLLRTVYYNLGRAYLRWAGYHRGGPGSDLECAAGTVTDGPEAEALRDAHEAFNHSDLRNHPNGLWGIGCVRLARGDARAALNSCNGAQGGDAGPYATTWSAWDRDLGLARAKRALNDPAGAEASYREALRLAAGAERARVRISIELAGTLPPERRQEALDMLRRLNHQEAYIELARMLTPGIENEVHPGEPAPMVGQDPAEVDEARTSLERAVRIAGPARGRAAYLLSLLEQSQDRGSAAVGAADEAVLTDREEPAYRRQACLMRIKFWPDIDAALRQRGQFLCAVGAEDGPEQHLYQGMYRLRETFPPARGGAQSRAWADALTSFTVGLDRLGRPASTDGEGQRLRARLARGQNDALVCGGLRDATDVVAAPRGEGNVAADADEFFRQYDLALCARREPGPR